MNFGDPSSTLLTFASTIAYCFGSAIIPFLNMEAYIVLLGAAAPRPLLPFLLVVATLSHMLGKSVMYLGGRSFEKLPPGRFKNRIAAAKAKLDRQKALGSLFIFVSALAGFPPFYLVAVGAGVVRFNFVQFFGAGFAGRLIRFGALILLPQLARNS